MSINENIETYRQLADKVKLSKVLDLLKMSPHAGQKPLVDDLDDPEHPYCNFCLVLGRRVGKTTIASTVALRELLIPFSSTVLITPQYRNAQILFTSVLEHITKLKLPIRAQNKNQFTITLENGSRFAAATQSNIESILGSSISLVVYDESQSIPDILNIHNQIILPTQLDYGTRANGTLYSKAIFLGTPRNTGTPFHVLYMKSESQAGWVSYNAPSSTNPLLPKEYIEEQRNLMPDITFRNELLAEFTSTGASVFFAFNPEVNLYNPEELQFDSSSQYILGLDWGYRDSTAAILVYVTNNGDYYVADMYQKEATSTKDHVASFIAMEKRNKGMLIDRFGDPSNPQLMLDLRVSYDYDVSKASNKVASGVGILNELFQEQGYNKKPKLFINSKLKELIRQLRIIEYKGTAITGSNDPFKADIESGTHFDAVHALRYAVYSHHRQSMAGIAVC